MASKYYTGAVAANVAQVDRFTPANVGIGDIFTLTATGEDGSTAAVSFTATVATVANVTAGLTAAWNASTNPLHTPITAADVTTSMTLTADSAGVPFSVASTTTDGDASNTQTLTRAAVTANRGPLDWGTALNWSDFTVPVSTDTVQLDNRMQNAVLYGLNQSAVTLAVLKHYKGAKAVGTSSAPLRISATTADINLDPTDGSSPTPGFIAIDFGTNQTTASVWGSANTGSNGIDPVCIKGAHASNVLRVYGGRVGVATAKPGDTANFPTVYVSGSTARVTLASGCSTVTTLTNKGGTVITYAASTTIDQEGGTVTTFGSGAVTTFNANGAAFVNSTGTVTTLNIEDSGAVDTTQTGATRTITVANVYGDGTLKTDRNTTYTNGANKYRGGSTSQINLPDGVNLAISAAP